MTNNLNGMQARVGLVPGSAPASAVLTPAQAAAQMSQQASAQLQAAQAQMSVAYGGGASFNFGQQFQQQLSQIQQQQSMGIQQAAAMAGMMPGASMYAPGMLPSPISMTPPSTGVFRPPTPMAAMSPIPPMQSMPFAQTPFTPQMPSSMFRPQFEQNIMQREMQSDRGFSMSAQIPGALGHGAGLGMGAMAGAAIGSRFGAVGGLVGGVIGAGAAQLSGLAGGMGGIGEMMGRPSVERHLMGSSIQQMSQNWVVGGPQLHGMGQGLSRGASMDLAGRVQSMAGSSSFKKETGGMFNRDDLMGIMGQAGGAGLMDQAQGVEGIQDNLRKVSRTIRRFMQLTNDPDVTSVIQEMGRMHQMGMSVEDIDMAAGSMRSYARAAGTSVRQMSSTYGAMGAQTYQAAGLSPASGMMQGMYAGASARQGVAAGAYNPRQLSMLGGVQGIAQRSMQTNAAMMSMPLMGAAMGSYGAGGWGLDYDNLAGMSSGQGGAQGLVTGAMRNMGSAVARGGVGALAMFPLQQRMMQAEAADSMSPYQQETMKFNMAMSTGKQLGLKGAGAFATGAQAMFGKEAAEQMMLQASSPQYWKSQADMIRREQYDLSLRQRDEIKANAPSTWEILKERSGVGRALSDMGDAVSSSVDSALSPITSLYGRHKDFAQANADRERGVTSYRSAAEFSASNAGQAKALRRRGAALDPSVREAMDRKYSSGGDYGIEGGTGSTFETVTAMMGSGAVAGLSDPATGAQFYRDLRTATGSTGGALDTAMEAIGTVGGWMGADTNYMQAMVGGTAALSLDDATRANVVASAQKQRAVQARVWSKSRSVQTRGKTARAQYERFAKSIGSSQEQAQAILMNAGTKFASKAANASWGFGGIFDSEVTTEDAKEAVIESLAETQFKGDKKKAQQAFSNMSSEQQEGLVASVVRRGAETGSAAAKDKILDAEAKLTGEYRGSLGLTRKSRLKKVQEDLTDFKDEFMDLESGDTGFEEFGELMKSSSNAEMYAMSAVVTQGDQQSSFWAAAKKEFLASKKRGTIGKGVEFIDWMDEMSAKTSKGGKGIAALRKGLGAAGMQGEGVTNLGRMMDLGAYGNLETSVGRAAGSLSSVIDIGDAESFNLESLGGLSMGQLGEMGKSGKYGQMAKQIRKAQLAGLDTDAGKKELRKAQGMFVGMGAAMEGTEEATAGARGAKAEQLGHAAGAVGATGAEMMEAFKHFNVQATKNFAEGAAALNAAMVGAATKDLKEGNVGKVGQ